MNEVIASMKLLILLSLILTSSVFVHAQLIKHVRGYEETDYKDSSVNYSRYYLANWPGTNLYNAYEEVTKINPNMPASVSNAWVECHYIWSHIGISGEIVVDWHIQYLVTPTLPASQRVQEQVPIPGGFGARYPAPNIQNYIVVEATRYTSAWCLGEFYLTNPKNETYIYSMSYAVSPNSFGVASFTVNANSARYITVPYSALKDQWNNPISINYPKVDAVYWPGRTSIYPRAFNPFTPVNPPTTSLNLTPIPTKKFVREYLASDFFKR
jgi:hypothetical protein